MTVEIGAFAPIACHGQQAADMRALITDLEEEGLRIPVSLGFTIPGDDAAALVLMHRMATRLALRGYEISMEDTGMVYRLTACKGTVTYRVLHSRRGSDCGVVA